VLVVNNNGAELTSNAILGWHQEHGVEWHQIASGKPMQNGNAESTESISVGSLRC
jgi:putative transposase